MTIQKKSGHKVYASADGPAPTTGSSSGAGDLLVHARHCARAIAQRSKLGPVTVEPEEAEAIHNYTSSCNRGVGGRRDENLARQSLLTYMVSEGLNGSVARDVWRQILTLTLAPKAVEAPAGQPSESPATSINESTTSQRAVEYPPLRLLPKPNSESKPKTNDSPRGWLRR